MYNHNNLFNPPCKYFKQCGIFVKNKNKCSSIDIRYFNSFILTARLRSKTLEHSADGSIKIIWFNTLQSTVQNGSLLTESLSQNFLLDFHVSASPVCDEKFKSFFFREFFEVETSHSDFLFVVSFYSG